MSYLSVLELRGIDRIGILMELSQVVTGELNTNIRELHIQSHDGIFEGRVSLYVKNIQDLKVIMEKVGKIRGIEKVRPCGEQSRIAHYGNSDHTDNRCCRGPSLKEKERPRGAALPEEKTTLPSSPWDDLIREIQSGRSDASPKGGEATSGGDRGEYAAEVSAEPATEAAAPAYYSYDEQTIDELDGNRTDVPFSYDEQSLADRTAAPVAAPVLSGAGGSEESEKPAPTRGIFADGFDPKMAVLYAEVMRPKV